MSECKYWNKKHHECVIDKNNTYKHGYNNALDDCIAIVKYTSCVHECTVKDCINCFSKRMEQLKK